MFENVVHPEKLWVERGHNVFPMEFIWGREEHLWS
jgi:hypothetical protein